MCQDRLSPFGFNSFGLTTRPLERTNEKPMQTGLAKHVLLLVCLFECIYVFCVLTHVYAYWVQLYVYIYKGLRLMLGISLNCAPLYSLRQGLFIEVRTSQLALGISGLSVLNTELISRPPVISNIYMGAEI